MERLEEMKEQLSMAGLDSLPMPMPRGSIYDLWEPYGNFSTSRVNQCSDMVGPERWIPLYV